MARKRGGGEYRKLLKGHVGATELADALDWLAQSLAGPKVPPRPEITPDIFHTMRCRWGDVRCTCVQCEWESKHSPAFAEWERSKAFRLRPWQSLPSLDRLLSMWAEQTVYRSAAGAMMDRGRDEADAPEQSRTPWVIRRVEIAMEVHRAVIWAYLPETSRHGLVTAACVRALVASVRGVEVGGDAEARAVRSGRRGVLIDMAARGLIRPPRNRRDQCAVAERMTVLNKELIDE